MIYPKYVGLMYGLIAWVVVGCATALPSAVPSVATVQAGSPTTTAANAGARLNFDAEAIGSLPKGAQAFSGNWAVRAEADAPSAPNALCQTGTATFPAIALSDARYTDVVISVRFKPISGREDQAAGIIFRIQDQNNYYILRANALEGNVNFYKYANSTRGGIKDASVKIVAGQWQELRVEVAGSRMKAFVNGQLVNDAADDSFKAGGIGLWTKADSVTCFDNFSAAPANVQPTPTSAAISAIPTRVLIPAALIPADLIAPRIKVEMANFQFSPSTLRVRAGQPIRLDLQNTDVLRHNFAIENSDVEASAAPGFSQRLDFVFSKPGNYVFVCNIVDEGDHRSAGMTGTLIVEAAP